MNRFAEVEFTFPISLDSTRTLSEMIAAGQYGFVHSDITTENFPATLDNQESVEIVLVHFNKFIESSAVSETLNKFGLRAATLQELLALGEKHPQAHRGLPILALGDVWSPNQGGRLVAGLGGWRERELSLYLLETAGSSGCRLAAVSN